MERECNSVAHYADSSRQAAAEGLPLERFFFFLITYHLLFIFKVLYTRSSTAQAGLELTVAEADFERLLLSAGLQVWVTLPRLSCAMGGTQDSTC